MFEASCDAFFSTSSVMLLATSFNSFLTSSTTGGGVGLSGLFGVFGLHLEAASGNITGSVN